MRARASFQRCIIALFYLDVVTALGLVAARVGHFHAVEDFSGEQLLFTQFVGNVNARTGLLAWATGRSGVSAWMIIRKAADLPYPKSKKVTTARVHSCRSRTESTCDPAFNKEGGARMAVLAAREPAAVEASKIRQLNWPPTTEHSVRCLRSKSLLAVCETLYAKSVGK